MCHTERSVINELQISNAEEALNEWLWKTQRRCFELDQSTASQILNSVRQRGQTLIGMES